jgi:1,4-alpha-glucan branching enzyme
VGDGKHSGMGTLAHEHGVAFRVWAPNAESVHATGDFTDWDDEAAPLEPEGGGCWYADVAGAVQRVRDGLNNPCLCRRGGPA